MDGGELILKALADNQWSIQTINEYELGGHQNWNFHRMVSAASDTVSPRNVCLEADDEDGSCTSHLNSTFPI